MSKDCRKADPLVSVVVPAFNEEEVLESVVNRIHRTLEGLSLSYEVIVVDDGSTDRTALVANRCRALVLNNTLNMGKGFALRKGFRRARGYIVVTIDADDSHRPEEIPRLVYPLLNDDDVDVVLGSRFVGNSNREVTSRLHLIGNTIINISLLFLTRRWISDSQSGFRAYRQEVLKELNLQSLGYEIESEMTVKVLKNGFKLREIPITCERRNKGSSKLRTFADGYKILKSIFKASFLYNA